MSPSKLLTESLSFPTAIHNMMALHTFLKDYDFTVTPVIGTEITKADKNDCESLELKLLTDDVKVFHSANAIVKAVEETNKFVANVETMKHCIDQWMKNISSEFDVIAEALVSSVEISYTDVVETDKPALLNLLTRARSNLSADGPHHESVPVYLKVQSGETDFLLVLQQVIQAFVERRCVIIMCASRHLMLPLFVTVCLLRNANPEAGLVSFIPKAEQNTCPPNSSSTHIILHSADMDSAVRACLDSICYHAGTTSWRPTFILVEQQAIARFTARLNDVLSKSKVNAGAVDLLDKNIRLKGCCPVPSYVAAAFEAYIDLAISKHGATVLRPMPSLGPALLFDVAPSCELLDAGHDLPKGPLAHVVPFRTIKESLTLANYFASREAHFYGATNELLIRPRIATVWTDSSSLAWQLVAKLTAYTSIAINADIRRLLKSFFSTCSFGTSNIPSPCCLVPQINSSTPVADDLVAELQTTMGAIQKAQTQWRQLSLEQRCDCLEKWIRTSGNDVSLVGGHLDVVKKEACSLVCGGMDHTDNLPRQLESSMSNTQLVVARQWISPKGPVCIVIQNDDPITELASFVVCALAYGNAVLLLTTSEGAIPAELSKFCESLSQYLKGCKCTSDGVLGNLLQTQKLVAETNQALAAFSNLKGPGTVFMPHFKSEETKKAITSGNFASLVGSPFFYPSTLFWSTGADLFAN